MREEEEEEEGRKTDDDEQARNKRNTTLRSTEDPQLIKAHGPEPRHSSVGRRRSCGTCVMLQHHRVMGGGASLSLCPNEGIRGLFIGAL